MRISSSRSKSYPSWQDEWVGEAQTDDELAHGMRSILGLLQRQAKLIVLTALVVLAATATIVFSLTPTYQASALVLVDPSRKDLLTQDAQSMSAQFDSARVDSEVEILRSNGLLLEVIRSQSLVNDPEFGVKLGLRDKIASFLRLGDRELPTGQQALGSVLNNLRQAVTVQRRGLTYIIAVDVRSVSPDKAAQIANAVVGTYIKRQVDSKVDATLVRRDAIRSQIEAARETVVAAENQYSTFISGNLDRLVDVTGRTDLRGMRDALQSLTAAQQDATTQIASLRRGIEQDDANSLTAQLQSDAAAGLRRQRQALLASLGTLPPSSKVAVNLRGELDALDQSIVNQAREQVNTLENSLEAQELRLAETRQNLNSALLRADLPSEVQARVYELLQVSSNATTNYQRLLARLQDLETQAALQVADSRVVSPALTPTSPSFPRTTLIFAAASLLALGAGVGLGFLFDNFIGGFTSASQVQAVTGLRLGTIVPLQKPDADQKSVADTLLTRPISRYAESIRRLRATIDRSLARKRPRGQEDDGRAAIIMVTSALPGEGKTTVSLSLARTYAAEGKRVLLIDCDLRRPSVHKQLGITAVASLPDLLNGKLTREDVQHITVKDPLANMKVILGKRDSTSSADQLLNRTPFSQLIESISRLFDYVILDSPPIEPVVDGLYLSEHADAIAFVVRAAITPQSHVVSALAALNEAKPKDCETLAVLNQEPRSQFGGYGTYGSYGQYYTD